MPPQGTADARLATMTNHRRHYQSNVGHYPAGSYDSGTYDAGYAYGGFRAGPVSYDNEYVEVHEDTAGNIASDRQRAMGPARPLERGRGPLPRAGHAGKGPINFQRSDERIHEQVCQMLTDHDEIDASQIHVEVKDGEVTLSGSVLDRAMKRTADEVTGYAAGVKDVHNRLTIGPPPPISAKDLA